MHLGILLIMMMAAMIAGKRAKKFGAREYAIAALLALIQLGITVQKMTTMEMPPLF